MAIQSGAPSRLYAADANLATLRFWLRFAVQPSLKIVTPNQHRAALRHLVSLLEGEQPAPESPLTLAPRLVVRRSTRPERTH